MWKAVSRIVIRFRVWLLLCVGLVTAFFAYQAMGVEKSQEFARVVPTDDPDYQNFLRSRQLFGEDANTIIIGLKSDELFTPRNLNAIKQFGDAAKRLNGVKEVMSITHVYDLKVDDSTGTFQSQALVTDSIGSLAEAKALKRQVRALKFYEGLLLNKEGNATIVAVTITKAASNSKQKHGLMVDLRERVDALSKETGMEAYVVGIPYIRSYMSTQIAKELNLFMGLAVLLTALSLYAFYRSFYAVIFPLILLGVSSVVTLGLVHFLGYKLNILSALLPPIIVILGIPSSIYLLSDYHDEYKKSGHKLLAISKMVRKLGLVTFMINANTAFGFLTLYFTQVTILQEFGLVAFISTMATYFLTMIIIPGVFSLLPPPNDKNLRHLDAPIILRIVKFTDRLVQRRSRAIFFFSFVILVVGIVGCFKLQAVSYMVDDLPSDDTIRKDLAFLESNFKGVMPFEIVIDTRKEGSLKKLRYLKKIDALQDSLRKYPELSRSISIVDALKWSRQAYMGGHPSEYQLPAKDELPFIAEYADNTRRQQAKQPAEKRQDVLRVVVDSTYRYARITCYVKDVGSTDMALLMDKVQGDIDEVFGVGKTSEPEAAKQVPDSFITGTTAIFLKANEYLIDNLAWSLLAVFILIGLQMQLLFGSFRIMIISMIPNIIPLAVTAGIMGYLNITMKPSTALIYELAFGIAIDNSIHYLAMYRQKRKSGLSIPDAVSRTLRLTGMSIIYTSFVLFMGFIIFTPSTFGSTQALGLLTSVTLFVAMFSNLLLMPALLLRFDKEKSVEGPAPIDPPTDLEADVLTEADLK